MPVILYNLDAAGVSKLECTRIEHAWNTMMYKIYNVSGDMPGADPGILERGPVRGQSSDERQKRERQQGVWWPHPKKLKN